MPPDTDSLPFLIANGGLIWKGCVLIAAALPAVVPIVRRRRQLRLTIARVELDSRESRDLRPGPATIRGRLDGAPLQSVRELRWGQPSPTIVPTSPPGAVVVMPADCVRLAGEIEVSAGTCSLVDHNPHGSPSGERVRWRQEVAVTLQDDVMCAGVLDSVAPGEWVMRGVPGHPVRVYAATPRYATAPLVRRPVAAACVLAAVTAWMALYAVGEACREWIEYRVPSAGEPDIPLRVWLGAMTPSGRPAALDWFTIRNQQLP